VTIAIINRSGPTVIAGSAQSVELRRAVTYAQGAAAAAAASAAEVAASAGDLQLIKRLTSGPVTPSASGTDYGNSAVYFWPSSKRSYDQILRRVEVGVHTAGAFRLYVATDNGNGTLSLISSHQLNAASAGAQVIDGLSIKVPANAVVGFSTGSSMRSYYTAGTIPSGEIQWSIADASTLGTNTAYTASNVNGVHWRATLDGEIAGKARSAYELAETTKALIGEQFTVGWPTIVGTGTDVPPNYSIVLQDPAPDEGVISQAVIGAAGPGTAYILVMVVNNSTRVADVISRTEVTLVNGVNVIDLSIPISAGQFVGIQGGYKFQNSTNPLAIRAWLKNGIIADGDVLTDSNLHRYEVQFTIKTGLYGASSSGAPLGSGLNVLASADNTGVADATSVFSSGRSSHPFPYVRPGLFSTTSLVAHGGGLWGPGRVYVGGERFFIPTRPMLGNLRDALRAALLDSIAAGDTLTLIADSIGHWAFSGTGPQHWFNLLTRFANINIAADEPIMTALRPSSTYTPDFYGVTTSGTVSTGTRGPLTESLILAAGASISFQAPSTGYEQVDVFYTQQSGAGSLAFNFAGGPAFKTVNAAGATELDKFSGPTMTGQTGAGTYTITASGGPVEITGLLRLGTKASGSAPRLRTLRAAHGSYTFGAFGAAAMASVIKMSSYAGGKALPLIALGINDSFGTPVNSLIANATAMIDALAAAGVNRIFAILPSRPTSAWDSSYTGGRTYDAAIGALLNLYRSRGVHVINLDVLDWEAEGLYQDGLHPNAYGNDRYAQMVIEGIVNA